MAFVSAFANRRATSAPSGKSNPTVVHEDLRGLDLSSPYDAIKKNRTPYAKNFRMYAEEANDRRVAISSRKGAGRYLDTLNTAISVQDSSTTGSTDVLFTQTIRLAMKFVPTTSGNLNRLELRLKKPTGTYGSILVDVYTNNAGVPGTRIGGTGILDSDVSSSPAFVTCRILEAPTVTSGTTYWIVVYMQEDAVGSYSWRNNTDSTNALISTTSGLSWNALGSSLAYKAWVAPAASIIGMCRYAPSTTTSNTTLVAIGTALYKGNDNTGAMTSIATGLSANATDYFFSAADDKEFWVNGYDDLKYYDNSTVTTITHSQLPKLRLMTFHKNRLFGVSATDPNKLIFSEDPGNGDGSGNLWYKAYLSTSFIYIPSPKSTDPITAIVPFQDNLVVFTRSAKYVLYGTDPGSFYVRQSTGTKGAVHQNAVFADENYIYFAAPDGLYRYNGTSDEIISEFVQPEFSNIGNINKIVVTKWKRQIRFFYPYGTSTYNNRCLIFHTVYQEWMLDTDTFVARANPWTDGDDKYNLAVASSVAPAVHFAEVDNNNLGAPIDFAYYCNYDSLGNPAIRKRLVKLFPLLEGENGNYKVQVAVDKDRTDSPIITDMPLTTSSAKIGSFNIGDGTVIGKSNSFKPQRVRVSGYGYYWQLRVQHKGINNAVRFIGYVLSYRSKRL